MFLFNDVIILCSKKDSAEVFDVQQVCERMQILQLCMYVGR